MFDDESNNQSMVDFANKHIGGGVLRRGAVQEELMFVEMPELLVSIPLSDVMAPDQAVIVNGIHRFSHVSGYSNKAKYSGTCHDSVQSREVIIMDARNYSRSNNDYQFEKNRFTEISIRLLLDLKDRHLNTCLTPVIGDVALSEEIKNGLLLFSWRQVL
ncbi:hypothetical protein GEMRC1_006484 [Eukaryota sp. GEM-RC1]